MYFHGFGGGKEGFGGDLKRFTDEGMATFSMTERGFRKSCGTNGWSKKIAGQGTYNANDDVVGALNAVTPGACKDGYIHLMDTRYEVRDAQYFAGILAGEPYGSGANAATASLLLNEMTAHHSS